MAVVFRLAGQAREEVADPAGRHAQPPALVVAAQQYLGDGHAEEFGVGEQARRPGFGLVLVRGQDVVVQMDVECGQKGVQVCFHTLIMGALHYARRRFSKPPSTI
ncbi:hypothetical protein [Nocardiopsis gilva]|uniref:hypothetical protein n=1 Tax=Nocardiopsis gilva TaxID=280236 RepID=UPI000371B693|nr:hypothetical protein [Nocardiopsis gilva]